MAFDNYTCIFCGQERQLVGSCPTCFQRDQLVKVAEQAERADRNRRWEAEMARDAAREQAEHAERHRYQQSAPVYDYRPSREPMDMDKFVASCDQLARELVAEAKTEKPRWVDPYFVRTSEGKHYPIVK